MDYRNITRSLLFNRALKKVNKRNGCALISSELYLLLAVNYNCSLSGCYKWELYNYLMRLGRGIELKRISAMLLKLSGLGYVAPVGKKFTITLEGKAYLLSLEKVLRGERYDR